MKGYLLEGLGFIVDKRLLVLYHVRMINTCQNSHFIYRVLFVFVGLRSDFYFFQGVNLTVFDAFYFVHT